MSRIAALAFCALLAAVVHRARAAELRDLADLDQLRALVDHDKSVPRLVLLLSPT